MCNSMGESLDADHNGLVITKRLLHYNLSTYSDSILTSHFFPYLVVVIHSFSEEVYSGVSRISSSTAFKRLTTQINGLNDQLI